MGAGTPSEGSHPEDPVPPGVSGYAEAVQELESILLELEQDDIDVDLLAERVRRASALIRFCRSRIARARVEVEQVVAELDAAIMGDSTDASQEVNGP